LRGVGTALAAVGLNAMVLLLHEGMHGTLFAGRRANRWVAVLLGASVLISFTAYRVMHERHHRYLGDPRDPDDYENYTRDRRLLWLMQLLRVTVGAFLYIVLIPLLALRHGAAGARRRVLQEYAVLLACYALVWAAVPHPLLVYGWLAPLLLVAWMTGVRGFTQHGLADAADPLTASRSIHPHPVVAFCLLNENLHLEHHLFPEVPSYHLPALHALLWPRLPYAVAGTSYLGFLAASARSALRLDAAPIGRVVPRASQPSSGGRA
jgi:fatty acid desaturase